MKGPFPRFHGVFRVTVLGVFSVISFTSRAADPAGPTAGTTRYGLLGGLDSRSQYGKGAFPEPFIVDDSDLEVNELKLNWQHTERRGRGTNFVTAEIEKGFGPLTIEIEAHYERDTARSFNFDTGRSEFDRQQGFGDINIGAATLLSVRLEGRDDRLHLGAAIEFGVPTNSPVSKHTEIVPKLFNDLRIGDHFTLQTVVGVSFLLGGGDEGGSDAFEYGLVFGYTIPRRELPDPRRRAGRSDLRTARRNRPEQGAAGQNTLLGDAPCASTSRRSARCSRGWASATSSRWTRAAETTTLGDHHQPHFRVLIGVPDEPQPPGICRADLRLAAGCANSGGGEGGPPLVAGPVDAGPAAAYAADGVYDRFHHQGFFIVRRGEKLYALSAICTHRRCASEPSRTAPFTANAMDRPFRRTAASPKDRRPETSRFYPVRSTARGI